MTNETATGQVVATAGAVQNNVFLQNTVGGSTNSDSYPEAEDMWVSTQIKMNLVGALTIPMTYHVYMVQFKKDYLCPDVLDQLQTQSTTAATANYYAEATAFWQAMAKPLMFNPILVQNSSHSKDMKILKHDVFHLEPKLTTEPGSNEGTSTAWPHVKTVSYFERMNRKLNYKWNDTAAIASNDTNATEVDIGDTRCTVQPKSRVYLIVAAPPGRPSV